MYHACCSFSFGLSPWNKLLVCFDDSRVFCFFHGVGCADFVWECLFWFSSLLCVVGLVALFSCGSIFNILVPVVCAAHFELSGASCVH